MATDLIGPADAPNAVTTRPADDRTFGVFDTWFQDCSSSTANDGTKLKAAFLNTVMGLLRDAVRGNGNTGGGSPVVTETNADNMLLLAIQHLGQRAVFAFATAGGTANAITASLSPAPPEYKTGMVVRLLIASNNTGAVTVNFNGLGAKDLKRRSGAALAARDLIAGAVFDCIYNGTEFRLMSLASTEVQRVLPFSTIYVRTDGNDANDGSANDAAHAFATINAALAAVSKQYILIGQAITVQLGNAGTYAGFSISGIPGIITLRGNPSAPTDFYIAGSSSAGATCSVTGSTVSIDGLVINNTGGNGHSFSASSAANVNLKRTYFSCAATTPLAHIQADAGSSVVVDTGCKFYGIAGYGWLAQYGGRITQAPVAVEIVGGPTFSGAFAAAVDGGGISVNPGASFTGSATGKRYSAERGGSINTNGAGAGYFPGSISGTALTGYYA